MSLLKGLMGSEPRAKILQWLYAQIVRNISPGDQLFHRHDIASVSNRTPPDIITQNLDILYLSNFRKERVFGVLAQALQKVRSLYKSIILVSKAKLNDENSQRINELGN